MTRLLLVVDAFWVAALAIAALAIRRETAILRRRLYRYNSPVRDGPQPGTPAPRVNGVRVADEKTLLFLSADCPPCFDLVRTIASAVEDDVELVVQHASDERAGDELVRLAGTTAIVHRGTNAAALREAFHVKSEPLAVQVSGGLVVGKGYVRQKDDLALFRSPVRR